MGRPDLIPVVLSGRSGLGANIRREDNPLNQVYSGAEKFVNRYLRSSATDCFHFRFRSSNTGEPQEICKDAIANVNT